MIEKMKRLIGYWEEEEKEANEKAEKLLAAGDNRGFIYWNEIAFVKSMDIADLKIFFDEELGLEE